MLAGTGMLLLTTAADATTATGFKAVHGADGDQQTNDIAVNTSGSTYLAGRYNGSEIYFDASTTNHYTRTYSTDYDGFIGKLTRSGTMSWIAFLTGSGNGSFNGVTVYPDGSGGDYLYVCGTFTGSATLQSADGSPNYSLNSNAGSQDAFIAKYDAVTGDVIWVYTIASSGTDQAFDVSASTPDIPPFNYSYSAIYLAGGSDASSTTLNASTPSTISQINTNGDAFVARYHDQGTTADLDWVRQTSGTNVDNFIGIASDASGKVTATGRVRGSGSVLVQNGSGGTVSYTMSGADDIIAACYSANGALQWSGKYGGSSIVSGSPQDQGYAVAMDQSGNSYIGGFFTGSGTFGTSTLTNAGSGWDSFVICVDAAGTVAWASAGGTTNTDDAVLSLALDNCGQRLYACGQYRGSFTFGTISLSAYNTTTADIDGFLLTMDPTNGTTNGGVRMGGNNGTDLGRAVAVNSVEDVRVTGSEQSDNWQTVSTTQFTNDDVAGTTFDAFVMKYDNIDFPVTATIGSGGYAYYSGVDVNACSIFGSGVNNGPSTQFGSTVLSSTQSGSSYTDDVFFTRNDKYGTVTNFVALLNGTAGEGAEDHRTDASGNNYICGRANGSLSQTINFVGIGSVTCTGQDMAWVIKTNSSGTISWKNTVGGTGGLADAYGVTYDNSGNVYVSGAFTGTVTFSTTSGSSTNKTASGNTDGFVAKYTSSGVLQWVQTFGAAFQSGHALAIANDGTNYYITGAFSGTMLIGAQTLTSASSYDLFVAQGSLSTGTLSKSLSWGGANYDIGYSITCLGTTAYVSGVNNDNSVFIGRAGFGTTTPVWAWTTTSSSGNAIGYNIAYNDDRVYVEGHNNTGTLTLGTENVSGDGAFVATYDISGNIMCLQLYASAGPLAGGLAIEDGSLNSDGGDNVVFVGGPNPFINLMSGEGCVFSQRLGHTAPDIQTAIANNPEVVVYPNPASSSFAVEYTGISAENPATLVITDMTGREISRMNLTASHNDIPVSDISNGVYVYQVMQNGSAIGNGRLVVSH